MWLRANAHAFTVCIFEILTNFCHWNSFLYLCILNCGVSCLFFRCLWTVIEFLSGPTKKTVGSLNIYIRFCSSPRVSNSGRCFYPTGPSSNFLKLIKKMGFS